MLLSIYAHDFSTQREDEIEEYLRRKYAGEATGSRHFGDGGEDMSDEITQQTLLPGVKYDIFYS